MKLLSLRLCAHDSNMCLYDYGKLTYIKTERVFGIKHHSIGDLAGWVDFAESHFGISIDEVDDISIILDKWLYSPDSNEVVFPSKTITLSSDYPIRCDRINHHYAHALSCWPLTKQNPDVDIVFDGLGDYDRSWSVFKKDNLIEYGTVSDNGSLGVAMSMVSRDLGIHSESELDDAGKLMGLQSYGSYDSGFAQFLSQFNIRDVWNLFDYGHWVDYKCNELLANHTKLDWIKTVHDVVGDKLVEFFYEFAKPKDDITYSGGVAQNVIWNTKLKRHFPNLIIPPHCGDDGLSLGGIRWLLHKYNLPTPDLKNFPYCQNDEGTEYPITDKTIEYVSSMLQDGKTVAWYQGNGELGYRALGNRSILMNPEIDNAKQVINRIKNREQYRPFGASILEEHASKYFKGSFRSSHMLYIFETKKRKILDAITHTDDTCRIQTVGNENSTYRTLLEKFYERTGCPVLLNTSLNVSGNGIAGTQQEAFDLFHSTPIDVLVIGDSVYIKDI